MLCCRAQTSEEEEAQQGKGSPPHVDSSSIGFFSFFLSSFRNSSVNNYSGNLKILSSVPSVVSSSETAVKAENFSSYVEKPTVSIQNPGNQRLSIYFPRFRVMDSSLNSYSSLSSSNVLEDNCVTLRFIPSSSGQRDIAYPALDCVPHTNPSLSSQSLKPSNVTREQPMKPRAPSTAKPSNPCSVRNQFGGVKSQSLPILDESDSSDSSSPSSPRSSDICLSFDSSITYTDSSMLELAMKKSHVSGRLSHASESPHESDAPFHLRVFSYEELRMATSDFSKDKLLGEGGFGHVYKGSIFYRRGHSLGNELPRRRDVAIKKLNHQGLQGHKEWMAEVNCLESLHHPRLVKLIGYCSEGEHRLLVYELMPCGSLDDRLFNLSTLNRALTWRQRMSIALDAASGLAYLHQEAPIQIIFRDLKTANILLDANLRAKLSDFGLARPGPEEDKTHVSTAVVGTVGYSAPEYVLTGHLTTKSDVWAFGIVLLELVTGSRALDHKRPMHERYLVTWVEHHVAERRNLDLIMDPALGGSYPVDAAQEIVALALRCVNKLPKRRPAMSEVVEILSRISHTADAADHVEVKPAGGSRGKLGKHRGTALEIKSPTVAKKSVAPLVTLREKANAVRLKPISEIPSLGTLRVGGCAQEAFPPPKTACPPHALSRSITDRRLHRTGNA